MNKKLIFVFSIILCLLLSASAMATGTRGAPVQPYKIGGTITVDGVLLTSNTDTGYVIKVLKSDGSPYVPAAEDIDGLAVDSNVYVINIPKYEWESTPGGATTGETAVIHVYKDSQDLTITSPTGGQITVGNDGVIDQVDLIVTIPDIIAPTVTSTTPADGATEVPVNTTLTVVFSEPIDEATLENNATVSGAGNPDIDGEAVYNSATNTLVFTPAAPLAEGTEYTGTLTTGITDLAGNHLAQDEVMTFTTTTSPTVTAVTPVDGAKEVAVNADLTATFSKSMNASTLSTSFTLNDGADVSGTVSYDDGTKTATFNPDAALNANSTYSATVSTAAQDTQGNALQQAKTWSFDTVDTIPPTVTSSTPANSATEVPVNTILTVTFSEPIVEATLDANATVSSASNPDLEGEAVYNSATNTVVFTPAALLAEGTEYTVTFTTGITDLVGNGLAQETVITFTTTTSPTVTAVTPTDGAVNQPLNTAPTATFSKSMNPGTLTTSTFTLSSPTPTRAAVSGAVSYEDGTKTATFTPSANLSQSTTYTTVVTTGAQDTVGNALAQAKTWSFTTTETVKPTVEAVSPFDGSINVMPNARVIAQFSEPMDGSTITTESFTVSDGTRAPVAGTVAYNVSTRTATFTPPEAGFATGTTYTATIAITVTDLAGNALAQAKVWSFSSVDDATDTDNDGVVDLLDNNPNDATIATPPAATGTGNVTVDTSANANTTLSEVESLPDFDPSLNQTGKPSTDQYTFPHGLVSFQVTVPNAGDTVTVTLTFPDDLPAGTKYYKVTNAGFVEFTGAVISGNTVALTLTDGGAGDSDNTANSTIVDPGGVAVPKEGPPPTTTTTTTTTIYTPPTDGKGKGGCFISSMLD